MGQSSSTLNPAAVSGGDAYLVYDVGTAWATSTNYTAGQTRTANGNAYRCITSGLSASSGTGPSGTTLGATITDNTAAWVYIGQKVVLAESLIVDTNGNPLGSAAAPFIIQMSDGASAYTAAKESGGNLAAMAAAGAVGGWTPFFKGTGNAPGGEVVSNGPAVLGSASGTNGTGATAFLQVHNLSSATGLGTSSILVTALQSVAAGVIAQIGGLPSGGLKFSNGIVLVWSSTQFTYTSLASNTGGLQASYK